MTLDLSEYYILTFTKYISQNDVAVMIQHI